MEGNIKDFDKNSQSVRPAGSPAGRDGARQAEGECCPTTVEFSGAIQSGRKPGRQCRRTTGKKGVLSHDRGVLRCDGIRCPVPA